MEKMYESFVEDFQQKLMEATGYGEEEVFYKKKEEYPPTGDDRIFVKRVEEDGVSEVCALYIKDLFEEYQKGTEMETLISEVVRRLSGLAKADLAGRARMIGEYSRIRKYLFVRLLNKERNQEELTDSIYREIGDIALVLYIHMGEMDGFSTSMKVKLPLLEQWGRGQEEIFDDALVNTYFISPPRIYCWEKMLFDTNYNGENFMDLLREYPIRRDAMGNCLSTVKRTNGAVAVFLPGVAARLACLLEDSLYLVFTSIHEVMIHSASKVDPEDLRAVLADTVRETTPEEDFLTFNIYYYDRQLQSFSLCTQ